MSDLLRLVALLTPIVLLAQKYEVHLSPRNRVGDVFLYTGKGTKLQQVSTAGQIVKQEEISAEFEGRVEVLEVDASGEPVGLALTVSKFTTLEDGKTSEVLKPGSIVVVDGGAENPVALRDGQISDDARRAFAIVYTPHKPGSPTDDDILGSKEPRAFGESWPINAKLAVEDAKKSGIEIPPGRFSASADRFAGYKQGSCLLD
jgi:hypothetical protein